MMKPISKVVLATGLSAGMLFGGVSGIQSDQPAHAATQQEQPHYSYEGTFNYKNNDALQDQNFYNALKHNNFNYEGLKVGQSTLQDVKNVFGNDLRKYYQEKGITYYEQNDIIIGIKDGKLVDLTLLVDKVNNSAEDMAKHIDNGEIYRTDTTNVAFYYGNSVVIKDKSL